MDSVQAVTFFSGGCRITGSFRLPEAPAGLVPCVIINHGYSGYKEEYDSLAEVLNDHGFATLAFDSRGCGSSQAPLGRMMCATEWWEDAEAAITWASSREPVDSSRIGYAGCSMGGALALRVASSDRRVRAAVAMCSFADGYSQLEEVWTERRGERAWCAFLDELDEDARSVARGETSRIVTVPYVLAFLKDDERWYMEEREGRDGLVTSVPLESVWNSFLMMRPIQWCPDITVPTLLLHGTHDTIVPPHHSETLFGVLGCEKKLAMIDNAPHPLPFCDQSPIVFAHTVEWFARHL